jgi:hypothetical protein
MRIRQAICVQSLVSASLVLSALSITRDTVAQDRGPNDPSGSSEIEHPLRFHAGFGLHLSQSLVSYPRRTSYDQPDYVRSYPKTGGSVSLDAELELRQFLVGLALQVGTGTEPPILVSVNAWGAFILGSGDIAPYFGGGLGPLAIGQDEKTKIGLAANATAGLLFFRSKHFPRPEITLQVFLPLFDTSNALFSAQSPSFWPVALLGIRVLI